MFTLEQRHQILAQLNFALLRNPTIQQYAEDYYDRDFGMTGQFTPDLHEADDIWDRLDAVERASIFKVQQVQAVLADLLTAEKNLKAVRGDNYALKKASDVEWDIHTKTAGLEAQRTELIDQLRYFLGLPLSPPQHFGGTLGRS